MVLVIIIALDRGQLRLYFAKKCPDGWPIFLFLFMEAMKYASKMEVPFRREKNTRSKHAAREPTKKSIFNKVIQKFGFTKVEVSLKSLEGFWIL